MTREQNRAYQKEYRRLNASQLSKKAKEKRKLYPYKKFFENLKKRYGVTEEWFNRQLKLQNGRCICGFEFVLFSGDRLKAPHVDHCHKTNRIRGLLCQRCNTAIGLLKLEERTIEENIRLLSVILDYLRA